MNNLNEMNGNAAIALSAAEVVSGIMRNLDGNEISSTEDGIRNIEADVAVAINKRLSMLGNLDISEAPATLIIEEETSND